MDPNKASNNDLLDELLGVDRQAFEEDDLTKVLSRSDPPSALEAEAETEAEAEPADDAPTGIPGPTRARSVPPPPVAPRTRSTPPPPAAPTGGESARPSASRAFASRAPASRPPPPRSAAPSPPAAPRPAAAQPEVVSIHVDAPAAPLVGRAAIFSDADETPMPLQGAASPGSGLSARDLTDATEHAEEIRSAPGAAAWPSGAPRLGFLEEANASADRRVDPIPVDPALSNAPVGAEDLIGELVDGRYRILRLLGVGGIGLVYLCRQENAERPVAMKVLRPEYVLHQDLNERFMNEARAASAIKSPRIVDTLDVGMMANGAPYFVMEYVDGETLASLLDRCGALEIERALDIGRQLAEGLEAAHAAGVVHRDLKPENVFLAQQPDGAVFAKIFDFGIAKVMRARKRLTYVGAVFGTPHYMSPEQARGEPVDERADIYALGVMLFEMITGSVPFDGEDPLAVMSQHVDRVPPLMSSVVGRPIPDSLEGIVGRCLAKDPKDRYANANELFLDLQHVPKFDVAADPVPRRAGARPETLHAHEVPSSGLPKRKSSKFLWASLAAAGIASTAAWVGLRTPGDLQNVAAQPEAVKAGPAESSSVSTAGVVSTKKETDVHFVLSPIDARLFRGDEDLGPMPVSVKIKTGEPTTLTVRRRGYMTRKVVVDGTETRVVIGLVQQKDESPSRSQSPSRSSARRVSR